MFESAGLGREFKPKSFRKPTEEEIEAYDLELVKSIRAVDLAKLKRLQASGRNLNASNQFGESLLHMACRRGNVQILSFLLREAHVKTDIRDDFGRSPLHDACWTSSPHFDIMDELLEFVDPSMLLCEDVRGSTPFDYVRRHHWPAWVKYLSERRQRIHQRIRDSQQQEEAETQIAANTMDAGANETEPSSRSEESNKEVPSNQEN